MRGHLTICCGLVLALVGMPALAADAQLQAAQRCVQISDSGERLACFDQAFAVASAPPALGAEQVAAATRQHAPDTPRSLDAKVSSMGESPARLPRITLDNGQVWEQLEISEGFRLQAGDTVRIRKGALGSYRMTRIGRYSSIWMGVRRLQ